MVIWLTPLPLKCPRGLWMSPNVEDMKRGDKYSILNATLANAGRILSEIALYLLKPSTRTTIVIAHLMECVL